MLSFISVENFLKIAKRADEMMAIRHEDDVANESEEYSEQDKFSFDWLMLFF